MTGTRIEQALERLREACRTAEGARLPSVRVLATRWGFSSRTLREAVKRAVEEGWLETRPGSGVWPAGGMPDASTGDAPNPRNAEVLFASLRDDIKTGIHPMGNLLPSIKDLARLRGLHPTTIRKALDRLQGLGLVERRGRGWVVSRPRLNKVAPVLLCIGAADAAGRLRMDSDREWDFWRELQAEALRNGLIPELVPWDGHGRVDLGDPAVLGVVVCSWHMLDLRPLLEPIVRAGVPCAVWLIRQMPDPSLREIRTLWFHDMALGRGAGRSMADHLRGTRHAKVAWISPFHQSAWARNRLDGFLEAWGGGRELVPVLGPWISEWDLHDGLLANFRNQRAPLHPDLADAKPHPDLGDLLRPQIERVTRDRFLAELTPALEGALASGATLWVAASDLVATWTLHWLGERGIQVPENLELASFDDTREASRLGLTSMRFDTAAMARAMLLQIMSSRSAHRPVTRYQGRVIPRGSTRTTSLATFPAG